MWERPSERGAALHWTPSEFVMAWHGRGTLAARLMARSRHRRRRSVVAAVCRCRRMDASRPEVFASRLEAAAEVRLWLGGTHGNCYRVCVSTHDAPAVP